MSSSSLSFPPSWPVCAIWIIAACTCWPFSGFAKDKVLTGKDKLFEKLKGWTTFKKMNYVRRARASWVNTWLRILFFMSSTWACLSAAFCCCEPSEPWKKRNQHYQFSRSEKALFCVLCSALRFETFYGQKYAVSKSNFLSRELKIFYSRLNFLIKAEIST